MDGIEATKYIKEINKNIPVIALTAYAQVHDQKRIMQHNFDEYLPKPVDSKKLLEFLTHFSTKITS